MYYPYSCVCFDPDGDYLYVNDKSSDGKSAIALWEDWGADGRGWGQGTCRQGICRTPYGFHHWAKCNKNYTEGHLLLYAPGHSEGWTVLDYDEFHEVHA